MWLRQFVHFAKTIGGACALFLAFAVGYASAWIKSHNAAASGALSAIENELHSIRDHLSALERETARPRPVFCNTTAPANPPAPAPVALQSARMLPHPPENRGRVILYESFTRRNVDGQDLVLFREFKNGEFVTTQVPSSEIRWMIDAPDEPR